MTKPSRRQVLAAFSASAAAPAGAAEPQPPSSPKGVKPAPMRTARQRDDRGKPALAFRRSIAVRHKVDVFIAGGGPAGVAAALAARSQGASVFLAENHTCFGGCATAGRLPVFMTVSDGVNFLPGGVGARILERLSRDGMKMPSRLAIHAESLKRVYDEMMTESGAAFTFQTRLIGVESKGRRVTHAVCAAKSGVFAVEASVFIDATGDGDLAAWAGARYELGDDNGQLMPGTLCSLWLGVDWPTVAAHRVKESQPDRIFLEKAFADGVFTYLDEHLTGMYNHGHTMGAGNIGHTFGVNGVDEESVTRALMWGRKSLGEYRRYYRTYLKGYENMELIASGETLGVRETRRITGDYRLVLEDFKRRAVFEDEIGRYNYFIDLHPIQPGAAGYQKHVEERDRTLRLGKGESYGIPYRTLVPVGLDNVLVAGRCISADRWVFGSVRVQPGCFITGQAAGVAAAMASTAKSSTRAVNVKQLQQRLKALGGFLPNA